MNRGVGIMARRYGIWLAGWFVVGMLSGCEKTHVHDESSASHTHTHPHVKPSAPALKTDGPPARLVADVRSHRFGTMDQQQTDTHVFKIRNEGEGELQLRLLDLTCGCTTGKLGELTWNRQETTQAPTDTVSVAPGASVDFEMTWDTELRAGEFRTVAKLATNDPAQPTVDFVIEGDIIAYVELTHSQLRMDEARNHEETSTHFLMYSRKLDDLQITEVSSTNPLITAEFKPAPSVFLGPVEARSGQSVTVKVLPGLPIGPFNATLTFHTNCEQRPTITMPVAGQVGGDVIITPADKIAFGTVSASEGSTRGVLIKVRGEPVQVNLTQVSLQRLPDSAAVDPVFIKVSLKKAETGNNFFQLRAEVPKGAPGGQFKGLIELECDHPTAKLIKIPVSVQVIK